jgi:thiamine-monophosphate kinase
MASESELVATLAAIFKKPMPDLLVGIGDDGAVAASSNKKIVMSTDMAVEGVHFKREWSSMKEIGGKITAANLADIYAMGGVPKYLLVSTGLPAGITIEEVKELANGIKAEADLVNCAVVGGDISKSNELIISIAAIGEVDKPVTRSGAKVGDKVFISNLPGFSAAGLAQLNIGVRESKYLSLHKKPVVPYATGAKFAGINAMADVSDGLLSECKHIADASKVEIQLDGDLIKGVPGFLELEQLAEEMKIDIWSWVLTGGEDHAFLGTNSEVPEGAYLIGEVRSGSGVKVNGASEIKDLGWRHF